MGKNSFFARRKRERKGAGKKTTTTMRKREREETARWNRKKKKEDRLGRCLNPWPSFNGLFCVFLHGIRTLFQEEKAGK